MKNGIVNSLVGSLNLLIEWGLVFLIVFTPLAFGAVYSWGYGVMELTICLLVLAWIIKVVIISISCPTTARVSPDLVPNAGDSNNSLTLTDRLYCSRFLPKSNACNLLLVAFALLVLVQIIPLPPSILKVISPHAYELYRISPGRDGGAEVENSPKDHENSLAKKTVTFENADIQVSDSRRTGLESSPPPQSVGWRTISFDPFVTKQLLLQLVTYILVYFLITSNFAHHGSTVRFFGSRNTVNKSGDRFSIPAVRIVNALLISGFLVALLGLLQHLSGNPKLYWYKEFEDASSFGPYINRNHFAGYINMIIPVVLGLMISRLRIERGRLFYGQPALVIMKHIIVSMDDWFRKHFFLFIAVILMISTAILSVSRGGAISIMLAYTIFVCIYFYGRRYAETTQLLDIAVVSFLITSIGVSVLWSDVNPLFERFSKIEQYSETIKLDFRSLTYLAAADMAHDYPVTGVGLGNFEHLYFKYRGYEAARIAGERYSRTHNDFIQILTETGVPGCSIVVAFIIGYIVVILSKLKQNRNPAILIMVAAGMSGLSSMIFHSFVDFNMQIPANAFLFFVLAATTQTISNHSFVQRSDFEQPAQHRDSAGRE